jgi:hypothetical protein
VAHPKLIGNKKFLIAMIAIAVTLIIDTSLVKINDLIDKYLIPTESKLILFSVNSSICLVFQFIVIKYAMESFGRHELRSIPKVRALYVISLTSFIGLAVFVGLIMFQLYSYDSYDTWINILIISISYGTSALLLIRLSLYFFNWYRSNHDLIVLLYFVSMSLIAFNLILTALFVDFKLTDVQRSVREFVGGGGDISGGKHIFLGNLYSISSLISFFSIWMTTAIVMNSYREKLVRSVTYWILLVLPLVYFLVTSFYQIFFNNLLSPYFQNDPVTVTIIVSAFLSLSKPIGGLIFAIAFWSISRRVSYERKMKISMVIAGWGLFFIFSANQAITQLIKPYPPWGITTVTILNVAAYLVVLGIYNSATLVSVNNNLRSYIHRSALKLLNPIGRAEMEREIQKTVVKISEGKEIAKISSDESFDFDENELKKYMSEVIKFKREQLPK